MLYYSLNNFLFRTAKILNTTTQPSPTTTSTTISMTTTVRRGSVVEDGDRLGSRVTSRRNAHADVLDGMDADVLQHLHDIHLSNNHSSRLIIQDNDRRTARRNAMPDIFAGTASSLNHFH